MESKFLIIPAIVIVICIACQSTEAAPQTGTQTTTSAAPISFEKSEQTFPSIPTWKIGLADLDDDEDLDAVFANGQANDSNDHCLG